MTDQGCDVAPVRWPNADQAIAYARDILQGDVKAGWGADWPYEMAAGVLELVRQRDEAMEIARAAIERAAA